MLHARRRSAIADTRCSCRMALMVTMGLLSLLACPLLAAQGREETTVTLAEEVSVTLPENFNLAGIATAANGEVLAWSREPATLLRFTQDLVAVASLTLPPQVVPVGVWFDGSVIAIISATPPTMYRLSPDGRLLESIPLDDGMVLAAAHGSTGWYLLVESLTSGELLVEVEGSDTTISALRYGSLTAKGASVWLTDVLHPFEVHEVLAEQSKPRSLRPPIQVLDSMRAARNQPDFQGWASLPVVLLDRGFLQTIADLATDRRLVVVYDHAGGVVASLSLDAPFGLMASAGYRVYGARRTDTIELVGYRYRWEPPR